jgi:diguanylate cyclase (GGDEF)-like protein
LDVAVKRAEKLRDAFKHLNVQHQNRHLRAGTLSLGVAGFPEHGSTTEAVLRAADTALYQAKREGRDRVVVAEAIG